MKKLIYAIILLFFTISTAVNFSPNQDAGIVSVSMDEESLQNLLTIYENAGYHSFGTTEKLGKIEEISSINKYYFENWNIDLNDNDLKFDMNGILDADARKKILGIPFHPHVKSNSINASANAFFKNFEFTNDKNVSLDICISDAEIGISDISYGYGFIIDKLLIEEILGVDDIINSDVEMYMNGAINLLADATNCIDITNQVTISFPEFSEILDVNHAGTKVENNRIYAYGCPIEKKSIDGVVVVGDGPCETVSYNVAVYTAEDIDNAGTDSKVLLSVCGDDVFGNRKCLPDKNLNDWTEKGQISHVLIESSIVLVENLSMTLTSDNSGKKPGWYVDSVTIDMAIPNNSSFHYWFPVHDWIGGSDDSPSFTFNQKDSLQIYTFEVATGDGSSFDHSGTDSRIVAEACDILNRCLSFKLDKDNHDDFESGSIATYTIVTREKLFDLKSMALHNIYDGEHPGWYVQDVMYRHYSFPENIDHSLKDGQGFMFRQWLADGEEKGAYYTLDRWNYPTKEYADLYTVNSGYIPFIRDFSAIRYVGDNFGYCVTIKTKPDSVDAAAGTDADITLTLEGCSGEKEVFELGDDKNNFEKGDVDVFFLSGIKDLKGIKKMSLQSDGSGDGAGWSPEYIDVVSNVYNGIGSIYYSDRYHHIFSKSLNKKDGWEWESELQDCPELNTPVFFQKSYDVKPGEYLKIDGFNLNFLQDIVVSVSRDIPPVYVNSRYAIFYVPEEVPLGDYDLAAAKINGVAQPVSIHVKGEKPILDGIAITTAKPEDAFEASMRNINESSLFYIGEYPLKLLSFSQKGAFLQIPKDIENGNYNFRILSNGWDITYEAAISIVKSYVPHLFSTSENVVYTGQNVEIQGRNFGEDYTSINVMVGDKQAEIEMLSNDRISIVIPAGVSGKDVVIAVSRENIPAPETILIEVKGLPWFMSFDDIEHPWLSKIAEISYDSIVKYGDIGYSLRIHGGGYMPIVSPKFNTYELGAVSDKLLLDVWIPENQLNPYWYGDVQMSVNLPAAGLYNAWIGQVQLTGMPPGWNTISFELSEDIYRALNGDYPNASISILINVNQNMEDYRIDNLRFGGDVEIRTTEHVAAGTLLDVYSTNFMSFDNINEWTLDGRELLFVESPKIQGLGATGVMASGYIEIKSRLFTPAEFEYVSDVISMDVYVPNPQPNDNWIGNVGLGLSCPDIGFNSVYLGNVDLTNMFREEYNDVQYMLPNEIVSALQYGIGECFFSIYLNVNNGAGLFLFDNMGFVRTLEVAGR